MTELIIDGLPIYMLVALAGLIFTGFPVAFVLAGVGIGAAILAWALGEFPGIAFYNLPPRLYDNISNSWIYPAVAMFLFMGVALEKSGIAREMLNCLHRVLRCVPGNVAIAVIIIGVLLAPTAGLVGASVGTLTVIALPAMLRLGYPKPFATSAVAAGGTLGLILPPGLMLIFLAVNLGVTVGEMFMSTVVPGLCLIAAYLLYFIVRGITVTGAPPEENNEDRMPVAMFAVYVLRGLALPMLLIAAVLGSIIAGWATTSQSAAVGALGSIVLMALNGSLSFQNMNAVLRSTLEITAMVILIVLAAQVFSYPFRFFSGDEMVSNFIRSLGQGDWGVLLTVLFIIFVLGFFIDWIEITVITLPIFFPLLKTLDFSAHTGSPELTVIWLAVLIALVLQTSFLTPPFGFALFHIRGAAPPEVRLGDIYRGVLPVLALQGLTIALVLALPWLATDLPNAVFQSAAN